MKVISLYSRCKIKLYTDDVKIYFALLNQVTDVTYPLIKFIRFFSPLATFTM